MNIAVLDTKTFGDVENLDILKQFGNVSFYETTCNNHVIERTIDADIIVTNKVVIDSKTMVQLKKLKLICVAATGTNNIDLEYAKKVGVQVMNVKGYSSKSVAQSTFALLFHLMYQVHKYDSFVKNGGYSNHDIFTHYYDRFWEINGKTFGIVGLGNIGSEVALLAQAFGARVVYYSTTGKNNNQAFQRVGLEELLAKSDFISIHAPLNSSTHNLIGIPELAKMKPTSILLNAGRGGIVDEQGLAMAIDSEMIYGAAVDVFEKEPIKVDNPLLKVKRKHRLVLTPHMTWASIESRNQLIQGVADNIASYIKGQ